MCIGNPDTLKLLITGLATGDSLGSTSEFVPQQQIPALYEKYKTKGWPFRQVGGGSFGWKPGQPTDDSDMALCIIRAFMDRGCFDGQAVAARFLEWMHSGPRDIGGTTSRTLRQIANGTVWYEGGLEEYHRNPNNAANGSLMRNGILPAFADSSEEGFRISLHHGIITHYSPLPVLCCAAQSYLIERIGESRWELENGYQPEFNLENEWMLEFRAAWTEWIENTDDEVCRTWRTNVNNNLDAAWQTMQAADWDADSFSPFEVDFARRAGYCLLTLQIAVWATVWASRQKPYPHVPDGFPADVFARTGAWTLAWVAMIGNDADTYGATAGPLIAAMCGTIPKEITGGLMALDEVNALIIR